MKQDLRFRLIVIFFLFIFNSNSGGQENQTVISELDLTDKGLKIENRIDLTVDPSNYENVRALTGERFSLRQVL